MALSRNKQVLFGLVAGGAVGIVVTGLIVGVVAYGAMKWTEYKTRLGWHLVPVVVAARDLEPGEKLSRDAFAQRDVPEEFATDSVVKPDHAMYAWDRMITVPLHAGDSLLWAFSMYSSPTVKMESPQDDAIWEACDKAFAASPAAARRERTPEEIRTRLARLSQREGK